MIGITSRTRYVVYLIESGQAIRKNPTKMELAVYEAKAPATRLANKVNKRSGYEQDTVAVCTVDEYTHGICPDYEDGKIKMVERVNLMTGKKYMEPVNTPSYCSPASESYWTM